MSRISWRRMTTSPHVGAGCRRRARRPTRQASDAPDRRRRLTRRSGEGSHPIGTAPTGSRAVGDRGPAVGHSRMRGWLTLRDGGGDLIGHGCDSAGLSRCSAWRAGRASDSSATPGACRCSSERRSGVCPAAAVPSEARARADRVRRRRLGRRRDAVGDLHGAGAGAAGLRVLVRFGSENLVGSLVALSLTRELAPVLTALMVTARAGSAMTATIGNMAVTEQTRRAQVAGGRSAALPRAAAPVGTVVALPLLDGAVLADGHRRRLPLRGRRCWGWTGWPSCRTSARRWSGRTCRLDSGRR